MTETAAHPLSPLLQSALSWLNAPSSSDTLAELPALRRYLADIIELGLPPLRLLAVLELFHIRNGRIESSLRPLLLEATVPPERRLRTITQALIEARGLLAAGLLRVALEVEPRELMRPNRQPHRVCALALDNCLHQLELSSLISTVTPADLWLNAQRLYRLACTTPVVVDGEQAQRLFKTMVAFACAQPQSDTAREVDFLAEYIASFASAVALSEAPPSDDGAWYWLEELRDLPPAAASRRAPPGGHLLFIDCRALAQLAESQLQALAGGEAPSRLGLPARAAGRDYTEALRRAAKHWAHPPHREHVRHGNHQRLRVCPQFSALWRLLRGQAPEEANAAAISEWMMRNESAGGFAIMLVNGQIQGLQPGSALGVRLSNETRWNVCLVRWARSDNPEHVELGLERLAPSARGVQVAFAGRAPIPAMLLPPMPTLDRPETLLVARGQYAPGTFTLIEEEAGRLRIAPCTAGAPTMQTASVEIFAFVREFTPVGAAPHPLPTDPPQP